MTDEELINEYTRILRTSGSPKYARIRDLLRDRGVDPSATVAVTLHTEDQGIDSAIVVTEDGTVIEFEFDYYRAGSGNGTITAWRPLPHGLGPSPFRSKIDLAVRMAQRGRKPARDVGDSRRAELPPGPASRTVARSH